LSSEYWYRFHTDSEQFHGFHHKVIKNYFLDRGIRIHYNFLSQIRIRICNNNYGSATLPNRIPNQKLNQNSVINSNRSNSLKKKNAIALWDYFKKYQKYCRRTKIDTVDKKWLFQFKVLENIFIQIDVLRLHTKKRKFWNMVFLTAFRLFTKVGYVQISANVDYTTFQQDLISNIFLPVAHFYHLWHNLQSFMALIWHNKVTCFILINKKHNAQSMIVLNT